LSKSRPVSESREVSNTAPLNARVLANFGEALAVVLDRPADPARQNLLNAADSEPAEINRKTNTDLSTGVGEAGDVRRAVPLKRLPLLVAGDRIECEAGVGSTLRATELIDRSSELSRPDRRGHLKAVAANITQLVIVCAPRPRPDTLLIDQFCVVAGNQDIHPLLVLNKSDLLDSEIKPAGEEAAAHHDQRQSQQQASYDECMELLGAYSQAGFKTLLVNTRSAEGEQQVREALTGHTSVFVGQSGVGKSSIIQRILPDREIRVGAVSSATGLGIFS